MNLNHYFCIYSHCHYYCHHIGLCSLLLIHRLCNTNRSVFPRRRQWKSFLFFPPTSLPLSLQRPGMEPSPSAASCFYQHLDFLVRQKKFLNKAPGAWFLLIVLTTSCPGQSTHQLRLRLNGVKSWLFSCAAIFFVLARGMIYSCRELAAKAACSFLVCFINKRKLAVFAVLFGLLAQSSYPTNHPRCTTPVVVWSLSSPSSLTSQSRSNLDKKAQVILFACAVLAGNSAMSVERQQLILCHHFFRLLKLLLKGDSTFVPCAKTPSKQEGWGMKWQGKYPTRWSMPSITWNAAIAAVSSSPLLLLTCIFLLIRESSSSTQPLHKYRNSR